MPVLDFLFDRDDFVARLPDVATGHDDPGSSRAGAIRSTPPDVPSPGELDELCGRNERRWFHTGLYVLNRVEAVAAEHCFRSLLELNPARWGADVECLANLGQALRLQGRLAEAEATYGRAVEVQPRFTPVRKLLIDVMEQLERPPAAVLAHVDAVLEGDPNDEDMQEKQRRLQWQLESDRESPTS